MHLPLECICSTSATAFQLGFARGARMLVPERDDVACEPTSAGLLIRAETETALERPIALLREVYGEALRVGPPTIRCRETADGVSEPYMGLRVRCPRDRLEAVRAGLVRRDGQIVEAHAEGLYAVVRATAPLVRLLGYAGELAALTGEHGHLVMWFSHYAPVEPAGPPGGAAA